MRSSDFSLESNAGRANVLAQCGSALMEARLWNEAAEQFLEAATLQPTDVRWQLGLVSSYRMALRLDEAFAVCRAALAAAPLDARIHEEMARVFVDRGERARARRQYLSALALEPDRYTAHLGLAELLLGDREFHAGWIEYEWREKLAAITAPLPLVKAPVWNGMNLPTGRILMICDQGFGDVLQFIRFFPHVVARCQSVVVACDPALQPLVKRFPGVEAAISVWNEAPTFVAYCTITSLGYILGIDQSALSSGAPYLGADPARVETWSRRLDQVCDREKPRVGVVWSGRRAHSNDSRRSMSFAQIAPLLDRGDVEFVFLGQDDAAAPAEANLKRLGPFSDYDDTAALISCLDLVITVDTSVAHLAGALGIPLWVMVASPADWRWAQVDGKSIWYPSARIFKQITPGDWSQVVSEVRSSLPDGKAQDHDGHHPRTRQVMTGKRS